MAGWQEGQSLWRQRHKCSHSYRNRETAWGRSREKVKDTKMDKGEKNSEREVKEGRDVRSSVKAETWAKARQRLSEDRGGEFICETWHQNSPAFWPLLSWVLNPGPVHPSLSWNPFIPLPTQPSQICLYPDAEQPCPCLLLNSIPHHLSYQSPQGFFISNKTVWSAKASWCQPVSAITRCSFTVAPPRL